MIRPYGYHETGDEDILPPGSWVLLTFALGHDPADKSGYDFGYLVDKGLHAIARLNHGYGVDGTIPQPVYYDDFARRVANFVHSSIGCEHFIVGNEPNHPIEWPGNWPIQPHEYVECYNRCQALAGVPLVAAPVAPWNDQVGMDWMEYFRIVIGGCENQKAIALHTYTHGADPALVVSEEKMGPPYEHRRYHFRAYRDFMAQIPPELWHLPVLITETNQGDPWVDENSGWVRAAYKEVMDWNASVDELKIHALLLYRWPRFDQWGIAGKEGVRQDFMLAIAEDYIVDTEEVPEVPETNWLENWDFEKDFHKLVDEWGVPQDSLVLADGWSFKRDPSDDADPELKPANKDGAYPDRVHHGENAQQGFWFHRKGTCWVYQVLYGIEPGSAVEASGWVEMWSEFSDGRLGRMFAWVGIDPYGTEDPESRDIVWSERLQDAWEYAQIAVETEAASNRVTVWFKFQAEWACEHNDWYLDGCEVTVEGQELPDKPPVDPEPVPVACDATLVVKDQNERIAGALRDIGDGFYAAAKRFE